jgi:hypothetical protein
VMWKQSSSRSSAGAACLSQAAVMQALVLVLAVLFFQVRGV